MAIGGDTESLCNRASSPSKRKTEERPRVIETLGLAWKHGFDLYHQESFVDVLVIFPFVFIFSLFCRSYGNKRVVDESPTRRTSRQTCVTGT